MTPLPLLSRRHLLAAGLTIFALSATAADRFDIAVTVDDLPSHGALPPGMTRTGIVDAHIATLKAHGVPEAFGFVNSAKLETEPGTGAVLDIWRKAGHPLGNHSHTHMNLASAVSLQAWQADVVAGEAAVSARMQGADWHYFRYPNLSAGNDETRAGALDFLKARGYRVADVSLSFSDWDYSDAYARCVARNDQASIAAMKTRYLKQVDEGIARIKESSRLVYGRVIPQVLLTHIGGWSAVTLPAVLERLDQAGAHYVTLAQAQSDPAYAEPGGGGLIERKARELGISLPAAKRDNFDPKTVCSGPAVAPTGHWTASWGTALMTPPEKNALPSEDREDVTLRQVMRLSLGGKQVRVRVSNLYGDEPLQIGAATFAAAWKPSADRLDSPALPLTFGGATALTLPAGEERWSDPLDFAAKSGQDVAVSFYFVKVPARQSVHVAAHATQYIAGGDQTRARDMVSAHALKSWYHVGAIDVLAPTPAPVLAAIGDSLTDGSGATLDGNERWTDYLVRRIGREQSPPMAVINAGIGGNQMLRDGMGGNLLGRFERDALGRSGVSHVLVFAGVNDLGRLHKGSSETPDSRRELLDRLQAGWRQLAQQAHARGACLYVATLTPYGGSPLYRPADFNEADRQALNAWIRDSKEIDGYADFDAAVRDAAAPHRLQAAFDSGDRLHMSPAGYRAMAEAVPLTQLAACRPPRAAAPPP